jgi:gliding motility-associated-like protein
MDSAVVEALVQAVPKSAFDLTPVSKIYLTEKQYQIVDLSTGAQQWKYYINDQFLASVPNPDFNNQDSGVIQIKQVVHSGSWSTYSNQYCSDSSFQYYRIELKPKFWLPNAFTPNHNTRNETFYPVTVNVTEYRMRIYDRWGNKVFDEINGQWDGIHPSGKPYPIGVYAVYVTYTDITGQTFEVKNNVTLLR